MYIYIYTHMYIYIYICIYTYARQTIINNDHTFFICILLAPAWRKAAPGMTCIIHVYIYVYSCVYKIGSLYTYILYRIIV